MTISRTEKLADFIAGLRYEHLPEPVVVKMRELLIDWFVSAIAGGKAPPVQAIEQFAAMQGPSTGRSTNLVSGTRTSAYFAAMINGASCHAVEQDDVHNGAVYHPAAVVFPPALALAEERDCSFADLIVAAVAGYEASIRVGEFMGRSHYVHFHTTGTVGTVAASVAAAKLIGLGRDGIVNAIGSAGTQASGLWAFLADAADSKQLHTARASANGLMAALLAERGMTGARQVLEGSHGMGEAMSQDADPAKLDADLGTRWATLEVSLKWHASCRHTHPSADALLEVMRREALSASDIARVTTRVHKGAIDVLGSVVVPTTVHQSKFSMGTVLGLSAVYGKAMLDDFETQALSNPEVARIRDGVTMVLDEEVDTRYPQKWIGKVTVETVDGRIFDGRVDDPKGDPGNPLSQEEALEKAHSLIAYRGEISPDAQPLIWLARLRDIEPDAKVSTLLN